MRLDRSDMRRDSIFYRLFQLYPARLFKLLPEPPDNAEAYRFDSVAVKEPRFGIDGVILPPEGKPGTVFFVEVQFQKDERLYALAKGMAQGMAQGMAKGEAGIITRLLGKRLGELSDEMRDSIFVLPVADLEKLSEALLDFDSLSEVEGWLRRETGSCRE